jgi:two-component system, OmpR family, sensor kinase
VNSIRRLLLTWQIGALIVTAFLVSIVTYQLAWDGFNRMRDVSLAQIAQAVLRHETRLGERPLAADEEQLISQVWGADGTLTYASHPSRIMPRQKLGLSVIEWEGEEWHVKVMVHESTTVMVAYSQISRYRMFADISPWLILPFGIWIFMLGGLILLAVETALKPLLNLQGEVAQRHGDNLTPLPVSAYPEELQPLLVGLNALLLRLNEAMAVQHRFIADAAHELRTPLTAVRLQAQLARKATRPAEQQQALASLQFGVDRATRLIDQLLNLARHDPRFNPEAPASRVPARELLRETVIELAPLAERAGIDLGLLPSDAVDLPMPASTLHSLAGNLIDNALRYAGRGAQVDVSLVNLGDHCRLTVADTGPGIPEAEQAQAMQRFVRLAPAEIPGSGLGLSIVQSIVDHHGGNLALKTTPGGGLTVEVTLPIA